MAILSDNYKGALLMVLAMSAFTINDAYMKTLAGELPMFQALFLRGCMATVLVGLIAAYMGAFRLGHLGGKDWALILVRAAAESLAAWAFLTALFNMPLANISAILQALPLTVTLGAALLFREPVGWRRMSAILVGFVGVMLIVNPSAEGFNAYSLLAVLTVLFATVRDLSTRRMRKDIPSMAITFITACSVTAFAGVMSLGEWEPVTRPDMHVLVKAAGLIIVAYICIVATMRVGEISFVAPFRYSSLIVALLLGYLWFGEWPEGLTLLGSAIVVGSGLFSLYREKQIAAQQGQTGQ